MFLGNRNTFGIEWHLCDEPMDRWLSGHACFWLGGERIGEFDEPIYMTDLLLSLKYPVGDCGNRRSERFCNLDAREVFRQLYMGLFESEESLVDEMQAESWARFAIHIPVSTFDPWRMYLIDCERDSRFIVGYHVRDHRYAEFRKEQLLEVGAFDRVVREFQEHLEAIWPAQSEDA